MKTSQLKPWFVPGGILAFLIFVAVITTLFHNYTEKYHESEKSKQITNAISKNLSREIEFRLQALKVFSSTIHAPPTDREFEAAAKYLQSEYSGFFAINFIAADGFIRKVYPYEANKAAAGRNLFESPDIKNYLLESKADGQPRASHRILTYQKIYAIVLYVPLYDKAKNFFGWMNGVLYIDHCLTDYLKAMNLENVNVRVRWHHPADTNILSYNWQFPEKFYTATYKIMNQTLSIDLAMGKSQADDNRTKSFYVTIALRVLLIISISVLVTLLTLSKLRLQKANAQLSLKNNLLNSLSHDLATPITSLNLMLDSAAHKGELTSSKSEVFGLLDTIKQMMKSVRLLHSYESGVNILPIEKVSLPKAVSDAIKLVEQIATAKKIRIEVSPSLEADLFINANAHTLVNNVLLNALSNAIKFSSPGGTVAISHLVEARHVSLVITNNGKGLNQADIDNFILTSKVQSRAGTEGETGTGLGLLQISGFMKIYGGTAKLEANVPNETKLTLTFESPFYNS